MQRTTTMNGGQDGWLTWVNHFAAGISVAALFGMLPIFFGLIASILACFWYAVQLHENQTVQAFFKRRRARKAAKLQSKIDALKRLDKIPPLS